MPIAPTMNYSTVARNVLALKTLIKQIKLEAFAYIEAKEP